MTLPLAFALLLFLPPTGNLSIRVTSEAREVEFGRAFQVQVELAWTDRLRPVEFGAQDLAPLSARLVSSDRREEEGRITESRRYLCHAFTFDEVTIPAPTFRARPLLGGPEQTASADALVLRVLRTLDPRAPGEPELPGGVLPAPVPVPLLVGSGVAAVALLALLMLYLRRRARRRASAAEAPVPPHRVALERLGALRAREPGSDAELGADADLATAHLRAYLAARFPLCSKERTTEELLSAPAASTGLDDSHCALLGGSLPAFDRVKFGRFRPALEDRNLDLDAALAFVRETAPAEEAP